jgi:hypothetical protein
MPTAEIPAARHELRVRDRIDHGTCIPAAMHQTGVKQDLQVLRRGRLLHRQRSGQVSDRLLAPRQRLDESDAYRFAERACSTSNEAHLLLGKTLHRAISARALIGIPRHDEMRMCSDWNPLCYLRRSRTTSAIKQAGLHAERERRGTRERTDEPHADSYYRWSGLHRFPSRR